MLVGNNWWAVAYLMRDKILVDYLWKIGFGVFILFIIKNAKFAKS